MKPIDHIDPQDFLPDPDALFGDCLECGHTCRARIEDDSFDHAFGTHEVFRVVSECCDAGVKLDRASEEAYYELINTRRRCYAC